MHWRKPTVHAARLRAAAPGLVFSLEGLFEYLLIERQIGDGFFEPTVFLVELLQPFGVVGFHSTELITPTMKDLLAQALND